MKETGDEVRDVICDEKGEKATDEIPRGKGERG